MGNPTNSSPDRMRENQEKVNCSEKRKWSRNDALPLKKEKQAVKSAQEGWERRCQSSKKKKEEEGMGIAQCKGYF